MEPSSRDTRRLVDEARQGDRAAYERLFRTYSARLEAAIERDMGAALRAKLDPKDVVQETYLSAVRDFASFEYKGSNSLFAWFRKISRNKLKEMYRHFFQAKKRDASRESRGRAGAPVGTRRTGTIERVPDSGTTPTGAASRAEAGAALAYRLARLPREYRLVISLVRIEEVPVAEAARTMGRSENAIKKLLARALEALKAEFARDGARSPLD